MSRSNIAEEEQRCRRIAEGLDTTFIRSVLNGANTKASYLTARLLADHCMRNTRMLFIVVRSCVTLIFVFNFILVSSSVLRKGIYIF